MGYTVRRLSLPYASSMRRCRSSRPPRRQLRQARQRRGGKRHAVVRADSRGQPILVKQPGEDGLRHVDGGGAQGLAAQEVATEAIGHRQRIAVAAVAGPKLSFVVGPPQTSLGARICVVGLPGCPMRRAMASCAISETVCRLRCQQSRSLPSGTLLSGRRARSPEHRIFGGLRRARRVGPKALRSFSRRQPLLQGRQALGPPANLTPRQ